MQSPSLPFKMPRLVGGEFHFRKTPMKRILDNSLGPAVLVIFAVAVLLPAIAYLEFRSNRKNLDHMLYSKGTALMESVLHDAENAVIADREILDQVARRLADNARYALLLKRKAH